MGYIIPYQIIKHFLQVCCPVSSLTGVCIGLLALTHLQQEICMQATEIPAPYILSPRHPSSVTIKADMHSACCSLRAIILTIHCTWMVIMSTGDKMYSPTKQRTNRQSAVCRSMSSMAYSGVAVQWDSDGRDMENTHLREHLQVFCMCYLQLPVL